jgi:CMP-N,N'-diacetyllegionaminic acid synthase
MKILFTICGRAGSKGVKHKNLRDFLGKPLSLYTLSAIDLLLKRHGEIAGDIAVNSDSERLLDIFKSNTIRATQLLERERSLGGDRVSKFAVIKDCYSRMRELTRIDYDMVVDLDITAPLRRVKDIEALITEKNKNGYDVVFSVTDARRNPYFNMVRKGENGYERVIATDVTTRQSAPEIYDMNASLYAYAPDFLMRANGIFDGRCGVIKMPDTGVLDIDSESDFEFMEVIASHLLRTNDEYAEISKNVSGE